MRIQIGIDDLSPRQTQSFELWDNVEKLLSYNLKVDLFVTFAMKRGGDGPYLLTDYPRFVESLNSVSTLSGVSLNVHGYKHGWGSNNNDEFLYAPKDVLAERLENIDKIIKETGLSFTKVFRPPAWKISQDGVDLLVKHGYSHLSLFNGSVHKHLYKNIYEKLDLSKIKVHYCNCAPPHDPLVDEDMAVTYHFATFLENALSDKNTEELLSHIRKYYFIKGDEEVFPYWIKEV